MPFPCPAPNWWFHCSIDEGMLRMEIHTWDSGSMWRSWERPCMDLLGHLDSSQPVQNLKEIFLKAVACKKYLKSPDFCQARRARLLDNFHLILLDCCPNKDIDCPVWSYMHQAFLPYTNCQLQPFWQDVLQNLLYYILTKHTNHFPIHSLFLYIQVSYCERFPYYDPFREPESRSWGFYWRKSFRKDILTCAAMPAWSQ